MRNRAQRAAPGSSRLIRALGREPVQRALATAEDMVTVVTAVGGTVRRARAQGASDEHISQIASLATIPAYFNYLRDRSAFGSAIPDQLMAVGDVAVGQIMDNMIARITYDPDRALLDGIEAGDLTEEAAQQIAITVIGSLLDLTGGRPDDSAGTTDTRDGDVPTDGTAGVGPIDPDGSTSLRPDEFEDRINPDDSTEPSDREAASEPSINAQDYAEDVELPSLDAERTAVSTDTSSVSEWQFEVLDNDGDETHLRRRVRHDDYIIQFNSGHGYNRRHRTGDLRESGLSIDEIESAIASELVAHIDIETLPPAPIMTRRTIVVNGHSITYRFSRIDDDVISVSTYHPGP